MSTPTVRISHEMVYLTSDRVTQSRILFEEYAPEIIYLKGIHNTVAEAIS